MSEWQPINTAPDDQLVVVGWLDPDDAEHPERYDFDYREEGAWVKHADNYEHFICVAPPGSRGPREDAPYTHWLYVPPIPKPPAPAEPERDTRTIDIFAPQSIMSRFKRRWGLLAPTRYKFRLSMPFSIAREFMRLHAVRGPCDYRKRSEKR